MCDVNALVTLTKELTRYEVAFEKLKRDAEKKKNSEGDVLFREKELNEIFTIAGVTEGVITFDNCDDVAMRVKL